MKTTRAGRFLALALLAGLLTASLAIAQKDDQAEVLMQAAHQKQLVEGQLEEAIQIYKQVAQEYASNRAVAAKALVQMGQCYEKLGKEEARKAYERVLRDYADQQEAVNQARVRLAALTGPAGPVNGSIVARRVWAGPDAEIGGGPSPDGRYLSFVDWKTGDLAVRDLRTGTNRHVTNKGPDSNEWADEGSVFSPNGRQLAYTWYDEDYALNLRVVGLDGSAPRVLYKNKDMSYVEPFDWSPDGKNILAVLTGKDRTNQIAWVSVADGSTRILRTLPWRGPGWGLGKVSLSPDGRYIAYAFSPNENSDNADIFLLAADGSKEAPLVQNAADNGDPTWAPDGKHVLFLSDRTGTYGLWAIRVENGRPVGSAQLVKSDIGRAEPMHFTRAGSFFYGANTGTYDVYVATIDPATWKLAAAPEKVPGHFVGVNSAPDWSPDGRYLVYTSQRKGLWPLWGLRRILIRSVETGEERELPTIFSYYPWSKLRWSPEGRSLLFAGEDGKGREGVYVINAQTGEATQVIRSEPREETQQAEWSPNGSGIFYLRSDSKSDHILLHNLQTGQNKELYQGSIAPIKTGEVTNFALSRDGSQLALLFKDKATRSVVLKVLSAAGGEPRELLQLPADGGFSGELEWTPDGREILFAREGKGTASQQHVTELWRIPANGGKPQKTELAMEGLRDLRFDRDGRRIAFSASTGLGSEVWVIENVLPGERASR